MQLGDGGTQAGCGFLYGFVDHVERGIGVSLTRFVEFQARGEQCLQRAVVQVLRHFPVAPLVGLHSLGNQLPAHLLQCLDPHRSSCRRERSAVVATASHSRKPKWVYTMFGNPTLSSRSE